jgi:hypothetical protein
MAALPASHSRSFVERLRPETFFYSNGHRLGLYNDHDEFLAAGYAGVDQVSLQHGVMLGHDGNDDGWVFGALCLVDRRGIGGNKRVELAKAVGDSAAVEAGIECNSSSAIAAGTAI